MTTPIEDAIAALRELIRQVEISGAFDDHGHALTNLKALADGKAALARLTAEQAKIVEDRTKTAEDCLQWLADQDEEMSYALGTIEGLNSELWGKIVAHLAGLFSCPPAAEQAKVPHDREKLAQRLDSYPPSDDGVTIVDVAFLRECAAALRHPAPAECEAMAKLLDDTHTWQGDAAAAVIRRLAPANGWRPIESAPKDGTRVLIYASADDDGECHKVAHWSDLAARPGWFYRGGWMEEYAPDAWMPLPSPPAEEEKT